MRRSVQSSNLSLSLLAILIIVWGGCDDNNPKATGDLGGVDVEMSTRDMGSDDQDTRGDMKQTRPPCPSPLTIASNPAFAIPFGLISLKPQGGSGRYRFLLTQNSSGAILNELTGAYLAGEAAKTVDKIKIEDLECDGQLDLDVNVVAPMQTSPQEIELTHGTSFTFAIGEGSGDFSFSFAQNASAATIDPASGAYTAGAQEGSDRVTVQDNKTGELAEALVHVVAVSRFIADPASLYLAAGEGFPLRTLGGSGVLDVTIDNALTTIQDDLIIAGDEEGVSTLTLKDRFLGSEASMTVRVIKAQSYPQRLDGELNSYNRVIANVDINGDGHLDAVLGHPEGSVNAYRSGAVYIYEGSAQGLKPTPTRVISGQEYSEELGHDVRVADLNNDGAPELIVSARLADLGAVDAGAVFIFQGVPGKFFSDAAVQSWSGAFAGDQFGYALAVCDVNGDTRPDLLVGAPFNEDRDAQPVRSNQGSLKVFLNYESGWLPKPDQHIYGKLFDAQGLWENEADLRIGQALDVGDFDGDGLCDAFVATNTYDGGRGGVFIYRGKAPDMLGPGGLEELPSLAVQLQDPAVNNPQFARRIAVGDLNGDGKADLLAGAYAWEADNSVAALRDQGGVFVLDGFALPKMPATAWTNESQMTLLGQGNNGSDHYGWHVEAHDVNGDGVDDAIINGRLDEIQGGPGSAGTVFVHYGAKNTPLKLEPDVTFSGQAASDLMGQAFWAGGDLDKDGTSDLVIFAPRADRLGLDLGELLWFSLDDSATPHALDIVANPSGAQQGRAVQFIGDLNGDGRPELATGGIRQSPADPSAQTDAGLVHLYASTATGFESMPAQTLGDFYTHSTTDFFGRNIANAGDFDGDGKPDLVVSSELEDRPSNYNASSYHNPNNCLGFSAGDAGALYIFRASAKADELVEPTPAFILHGSQSSDRIIQVIGNLDVNGDGKKDILYSSYLWDDASNGSESNRGGFGIILGGHAATPDKITVLCDADYTFYGDLANGHLGWSLAPAGDVNADGCDDFVVGARSHSQSFGSQGQVRLYFGWGPTCETNTARMIALAPGVANARVGAGVAGGHDLDGDNIPDLVVSGDTYRVGSDSVGAAWALPGSYLKTLPKERACHEAELGTTAATYSCPVCPPAQVADGTCNPREAKTLRSLTPTGYAGPLLVAGKAPGEAFGTSITLVPGVGPQGRALIGVGSPQADRAGVPGAGGAFFYAVTGAGASSKLDPAPVSIFGGEPSLPGSLLGEELHAISLGAGKAMCVIGGTRSDAVGVDQGAAFVMPFGAP